jgi:hypothetical protein
MDKYSKTGKRIILCYLPRKFYLEGAFRFFNSSSSIRARNSIKKTTCMMEDLYTELRFLTSGKAFQAPTIVQC